MVFKKLSQAFNGFGFPLLSLFLERRERRKRGKKEREEREEREERAKVNSKLRWFTTKREEVHDEG